MDYNAPTGSTDLNAPYIGKNVSAGIQGSKVPPKAVEFPQREIVNAILGAGLTPSNGDQTQLWQAIQKACQGQGIMVGTAGGTANAITTTLDPVPGSPASWTKIRLFLVKITATNTDVATIAPNGLAARNFKRNDGSAALSAGDLAQGGVALCLNDGTNVQLLAMLPQTIVPVVANTLHGLFNVRLLTTSGTYYPTAGAKRGLAFVTGGGGAGGNAVGGGGGSGSTAIAFFDATTIGGGGIPYVIGGYGVPNPGTGSIIWGGNGGDSWFGNLAYAGGGGGGSSSDSSTTNGIGGAPGVASNGIFYIGGNAGTNGTGSNGQPGDGGAGAGSFWGGGAAGGHNTSTSGGADGYAGVIGGGGGGADGPNPNKGGGGGYGIIFILEFA